MSVGMLTSNRVDYRFKPQSGQPKIIKLVFAAVKRSVGKDWLVQNPVNVSK